MLFEMIKDDAYVALMHKHIEEILAYLFEHQQNFGILCKIEHLSFTPELPEHISSEFHPMTLFYLAGYTYDSANIQEGFLSFEAGFGEENIGSVVHVPLISIVQIIVDETPIFVNLATRNEAINTQTKRKEDGIENSMSSFLSNPENQKFIKK